MRVLVIGPSPTKSKGGMATVIKGISEDKYLNSEFDLSVFSSYIDGAKWVRVLYSIFAYIKFLFSYQTYDLFHIHMASYGSTFRKAKYVFFLKKHRKKVILHIHGAAYMEFFGQLSAAKKQYVIHTLNCADMVIALSDEWKERFETAFGLCNCVVLNNGVETEAFAPAIIDVDNFCNAFLFLGRFGKRKGAYDLIDAVDIVSKKHPEVKLYMAGDGELEKVREIVDKKHLKDHIEVVGWVDFAGKIKLLQKVSTLVLPSYNEGLPMAILEGMAAGKAIISTTVGAIPEVVAEENGILIEPGDVAALVSALEKCIESHEMVADMSNHNIKRCNECYSRERTHRLIAEYYIKTAVL